MMVMRVMCFLHIRCIAIHISYLLVAVAEDREVERKQIWSQEAAYHGLLLASTHTDDIVVSQTKRAVGGTPVPVPVQYSTLESYTP
jgi:hypothetical protein